MRRFLIVAAAIFFCASQAFGKPTGVPLSLEQMARNKFPDPPLSAAEERVVRAAPDGTVADCRKLGGGDDPANADAWPASRNVRAELIRWLFVDREAGEQVDPRGVQIQGARITGALDLSFTNAPFPLFLLGCRLEQDLDLKWAKMPVLDLAGSWTGPIFADGLKLEGALFLSDGFRAEGEVRLPGATIGGDLEANGGTFENPNGDALNADDIKVTGNAFLADKFVAAGQVRLLDATLGGNLDATGGTFKKSNGNALSADRIKVTGSVFLMHGFHAEGEVVLLGATIGGDLVTTGGTFKNPNGYALNAANVKVSGNVFQRGKSVAEGEVLLDGAEVKGQLAVDDAWLDALSLDSAHITGPFIWRNIHKDHHSDFQNKEWKPLLNLTDAKVGALADEEASWPEKGRLFLDGFVYDRIAKGPVVAKAPTDAKTRLRWLHLQPDKLGYLPQPYEQLIAVLRQMGHEDQVAEVAIAKKLDLREHGGLGWWGKLWSRFLYRTVRYGYEPWRALKGMAILVLLGTLMFWGAHFSGIGVMVPSDKEAYEEYNKSQKLPAYYPGFHALLYSLDVVLPFDLGQKSHWRLSEKQSGALVYWIFEGYSLIQLIVGWMLLLIAAAVLAGLIK